MESTHLLLKWMNALSIITAQGQITTVSTICLATEIAKYGQLSLLTLPVLYFLIMCAFCGWFALHKGMFMSQ